MSIGYTSKGTHSATAVTSDIALSSVSLATGSTLVVFIGVDETAGPIDSVKWNGLSLSSVASRVIGASTWVTYCYVLANVTGATGDIVVAESNGGTDYRVIAQEITGAASSPTDKTAVASGTSGTSQSSGNTATTTQNNEIVLGCVSQNRTAISGTWSGSLVSQQSSAGTFGGGLVGAMDVAMRVVSATGAYAAAKTGAVSGAWSAICVTLKESVSGDVSLTCGPALGTSSAPAPSVALGTDVAAGPALGISGGDAPFVATSVLYPAVGLAQGSGVVSPDQARSTASIGVRSFGQPYFAMWMQSPSGATHYGAGETSLGVVMALHAPPTKISSDAEPHWIASVHEIGGPELFSLGVTPDRRLCAWTYTRGLLMSAPGTVPADGTFHGYALSFYGPRELSMDGAVIAMDEKYPGGGFDGAFSNAGKPIRVMAFNGVAGTTLADCSIFNITLTPGGVQAVVWPFSEGSGDTAFGSDTLTGDPTDYPGEDFTLTAGWYDPRPAYALSLGSVPTDGLSFAYRWLIQTQYRRATVIRPGYRAATTFTGYRPSGPSGPTGFHPGGGVQPT